MEISNDGSSNVDYVKYFTKQLPLDLARLASMRDELEKRQGALTAVEDSLADRAKARKELEDAKTEAADIVASAKADAAAAAKKKSDIEIRDKEQTTRETNFTAYVIDKEAELAAKERRLNSIQSDLDARKDTLDSLSSKLNAERAALDARIKAFQDKVAALNI